MPTGSAYAVVIAGSALGLLVAVGLSVGGGILAVGIAVGLCIVVGSFLITLAWIPDVQVEQDHSEETQADPWDAIRNP